MATFMLAAIYFHISISDPFIPTLPSSLMLLSCIAIIYLDKKLIELNISLFINVNFIK